MYTGPYFEYYYYYYYYYYTKKNALLLPAPSGPCATQEAKTTAPARGGGRITTRGKWWALRA